MHGATLKDKPYYRCNAQRPDYAQNGEHPKTTAVREERILAALDPWLGQITDPGHRADTIAAVLVADADEPRARQRWGPASDWGRTAASPSPDRERPRNAL